MNSRLKISLFALTILGVLITLPHFLKFHHQDLLIFLTINVLVVCSYRIVTLTGEWSLIHAVMMGVGGYTATLLFKNFELQIWFTLPLAGGVSALIAGLLCFPLFRMTQFYFLIGSFAAGEAIRLCWIQYVFPFGGTGGLSGVEPPIIGNVDFLDAIPYYYLTLFVVSVCLFILYRIENSRIGLTLHSVHWKAPLAESVGVDTWRYRALAFVIGSFFCRHRRWFKSPLPRYHYAKSVWHWLYGVHSHLGHYRWLQSFFRSDPRSHRTHFFRRIYPQF